MKKFLFIFLSIFCCEQTKIEASMFQDIASMFNTYLVNQAWVRAVICDDISTVNNLAIACPELVNQKMNFARPWEEKNETMALHYATQTGHAETLTVLIARGASRKIKNSEGLNAQQIAEQSQSPEIKRLISSPKTQQQYYSRKSA